MAIGEERNCRASAEIASLRTDLMATHERLKACRDEMADTTRQLAASRNELAANQVSLRTAQQRIVDLETRLTAQTQELAALESNFTAPAGGVTWKITGPLRVAARWAPHPIRRAVRYAVGWAARAYNAGITSLTGFGALPRAPASDSFAEAYELEKRGAFNQGWYGATALLDSDRYYQARSRSHLLREIVRDRYERQTHEILAKYYPGLQSGLSSGPATLLFAELVEKTISEQAPRLDLAPSRDVPTYSIVTRYDRHKELFRRCAASVNMLIQEDFRKARVRRIEWIIVNDDPLIEEAGLRELIPNAILPFVQIISDARRERIVASLNDGVGRAVHEWVLLVDCDDLIESDATLILDHYVRKFRHCRYILGMMSDIDEGDNIIRRRFRDEMPTSIFRSGTIAEHFKAVRRDLFDDIGMFDEQYPGSHDYDFSLRVSIREPILLVPEYLYRYRWHSNAQSVNRIHRQNRMAAAVRRDFCKRLVDAKYGANRDRSPGRSFRPVRRGLCLVRTQGRRLDLLNEALASIRVQRPWIEPCVIIHGDKATHESVSRWTRRADSNIVTLHASECDRKRGYPLNVGLDYAEENAKNYDFVCLLDDDDIYYPGFGDRVRDSLSFSNCDVAYVSANQREKTSLTKSPYLPMPASCLVWFNFIPSNCFAVRIDHLTRTGIRFPEDFDYLEDWHFLVSLVATGAKFHGTTEYLAEYRLIGDGNRPLRRDPKHFDECHVRMRTHGREAAARQGLHEFYRDCLEFDFSRRPALDPAEIDGLNGAHGMFQEICSEKALEG